MLTSRMRTFSAIESYEAIPFGVGVRIKAFLNMSSQRSFVPSEKLEQLLLLRTFMLLNQRFHPVRESTGLF